MDRKSFITFIGVYSVALAASLFFGGNEEINIESVVDQPASYIPQGESAEKAAGSVGDILPFTGVSRRITDTCGKSRMSPII